MASQRAEIRAAIVSALKTAGLQNVFNYKITPWQSNGMQDQREIPAYNVLMPSEISMTDGDNVHDSLQRRSVNLIIECITDDWLNEMPALENMLETAEAAMDSIANIVPALSRTDVEHINYIGVDIHTDQNGGDRPYMAAILTYDLTYIVDRGEIVTDEVTRIDTTYDLNGDYGYNEANSHATDETDLTE